MSLWGNKDLVGQAGTVQINLSTEVGNRGTLANNLVRDRYVNIHLGFTLNDKWFQKTYIE